MSEVFLVGFSRYKLCLGTISARSPSRAYYKQYKQTKKIEKDLGLQRGKLKRPFLIV